MREEVEGRPFLALCLALCIGLAVSYSSWLLIGIAVLIWAIRPRGLRIWMGVAFLLGVLLWPNKDLRSITEQYWFDGLATVETVPRLGSNGSSFVVISGDKRFGLKMRGFTPVTQGDVLRFRTLVKPLPEIGERYWLRLNATGVATLEAPPEIVERGPWLFQIGAAWRASFVRFTSESLVPKADASVDALCFNVDAALDPELREDLQRTGTAHIISASGLHVMIFAVAVQLLLSRLPIPRGWQLALLILLLLVYAGATGLRPPVIRAVLMAALVLGAYNVGREPDLLSSLGFAGLFYLLWKPHGIADVGFQLSFVTVGALALYLEPLSSAEGLWRGIAQSTLQIAKLSLVATLASAPLVAYYFGIVSLVGVLANLLVSLVLMPVIGGALLSWLTWGIVPSFSSFLMKFLVEPLTGWILLVVESLGNVNWSAVEVPAFSPWLMVLYYGGFVLLWRRRARPA
ncbi:MAG TPA: ComEC/Rec2 family competence protein [Fimbriimonadaceae bacterium]|nr:ComEC/Rec2 family competence protein [Fimbriimonadaceae bacterium]